MNDTLEITTLGGLQVRVGCEPVTGFYSRKVEALLVYLACAGRPQPRDVLADLLWDEVTQSRAMGSLRVALHHLREKVGPYVEITRTTVGLITDGPVWLDVAEIELGLASPDIDTIADAVDLYQGDFLAGFYVRDCPRFEEWQLVEQERLHNLVVGALGALVNHYMDQNAYDSALEHARRLLELDPLLEDAHRQVMACLANMGQRSAALAQYEVCRQVLEDELGVEPEDDTAALYESILVGELAPTPDTSGPTRQTLPVPDTPFVGREGVLAEIGALLEEPGCRLLTLVGPGGSGKTRLALETAERQMGRFSDGAFFVSLAPLTTADSIAPTVADAIGFAIYSDKRQGVMVGPEQQVLGYLRDKQMLLVMDNFEHLLEGGGFVTEINRTAPRVQVLATSRARLNVGGEQRYQVSGMLYPQADGQALEPVQAEGYSAIKLFLQSARRATLGFELSEDNVRDVVETCRLVDGMPLAIRLAAGWVDTLALPTIVQEIARSLDLLETELRDVPARQRSVRAAFDHSWRLLSDREQELFQALSVFRGRFTRDAAQAVASASLRELRSLVNKSLVQLGASGRYGIHELLRQYGAEQLEASPDGGAGAHDRHCAHYAAALQQWAADLKGARQQEAMAKIAEDRENANAAWRWAVEHEQLERLSQAMEAWGWYHLLRGQHRDGEAAFGLAADRLRGGVEIEKSGGPFVSAANDRTGLRGAYALRVLVRVLAWQAWLNWFAFSREEVARALAEETQTVLEEPALAELDTREERAVVLFSIGGLANLTGNADEAIPALEASLNLYQESGDRFMMAQVLGHLSNALLGVQRYDGARRRRLESLELRRAVGDTFGVGASLLGLMDVAVAQGQLEQAEQLGREGLAAFRASDSRFGVAVGTCELGWTLVWIGDFNAARQHFERSSKSFDDLGVGFHRILQSRLGLCWADLGLGRYEDARTQTQECLDLAREGGPGWAVGYSLAALGELALMEGSFENARQLFREGAAVSRESDPQRASAWFAAWLSLVDCHMQQLQSAREYLNAGLRTIAEYHLFLPALWAVPAAALFLARQKRAERAAELYALALRYGVVANSQWFEDVVGKQIAACAANLPPDVVAEAKERGRARDLWETVEELLEELNRLEWDD